MDKLKNKKKALIIAAAALVFSVILLFSAVYGWFSISFTPNTNEFLLKVTSIESVVNYNIEGMSDVNTLPLDNACPGKDYKFSLNIENKSEETANLKIYFSGFTEPVLENGIYVDMCDVFMVGFKNTAGEFTSLYYFRDTAHREGPNVIIYEDELGGLQTVTVEFYLYFSTEYTYWNGTQYVAGNMNVFQGKTFEISNLVVALN